MLIFSPFIDPSQVAEKAAIRETVGKLAEEKDGELRARAEEAAARIKAIDGDVNYMRESYENSKQKYIREQMVEQVQVDTKKHIKTEKCIPKDPRKKDKPIEKRGSLNLKEFRSEALLDKNEKPPKVLTNNNETNKTLLTRCSSTSNKANKPMPMIPKKPSGKF